MAKTTTGQSDRLTSVIYGIDRMEACILRSAKFPSKTETKEFRDRIETLRAYACRLFSGQLSDSQLKRAERLKDEKLFEIVESLVESGWLDQLA